MDDGSVFAAFPAAICLAELDGIGADGLPRVRVEGEVRAAQSLVALAGAAPGFPVALAFVDGDRERPLILGVVQPPERVVQADGRREIVGEREVVLRCGPASIRLTADGRVTIRGTRILSRADASNRVQGASVELN
jgi:Domain of unknown function (DUF6484)